MEEYFLLPTEHVQYSRQYYILRTHFTIARLKGLGVKLYFKLEECGLPYSCLLCC